MDKQVYLAFSWVVVFQGGCRLCTRNFVRQIFVFALDQSGMVLDMQVSFLAFSWLVVSRGCHPLCMRSFVRRISVLVLDQSHIKRSLRNLKL